MIFSKFLTQKSLSLGLLLACLLAFTPGRALAQSPDIDPPDGFRRVDSEDTVELYRKDYAGGSPDYVQVVYLDRGARLELLSGRVTEDREGKGAFGGDDARILSQTLEKYWNQAREQFGATFCVTNGTFFYMRESPTRLPFPLKIDGEVISDGYAKSEFKDEKLMLELWPDRADIKDLTKEDLYNSSAPDILGGLHEDAEKASKKYVARTFVGVLDGDQDGAFETVLVFNTTSARTSDAGKALRRFGAEKVMMLDGGGSTQLMCKGKPVIASERLIPQALAVMYGPIQDRSSNSIQASADSPPEEPPEQAEAGPMEMASADPEVGAGRISPEEAEATPFEMASADPEVGVGRITAVDTGLEEVEFEYESRILTASTAGELNGEIRLGDVAWVPAGMFPVAVLLMVAIARRRGV